MDQKQLKQQQLLMYQIEIKILIRVMLVIEIMMFGIGMKILLLVIQLRMIGILHLVSDRKIRSLVIKSVIP